MVSALLLSMGGCTSNSVTPVSESNRLPLRDFSGHWEVDFSASDTVRGQVVAGLRQSRRTMERRSSGMSASTPGVGFRVGGASGDELMAVAEMVEVITEPQLLEIRQSPLQLQIRRENSFPLVCDLTKTPPVVTETPVGREVCNWSGREVKFLLELREGLRIEHQLLLSTDGSAIAFSTAVTSSQVSEPMSVRRLFNRYDPSREVYRCQETLTRGRVCTTEAPPTP